VAFSFFFAGEGTRHDGIGGSFLNGEFFAEGLFAFFEGEFFAGDFLIEWVAGDALEREEPIRSVFFAGSDESEGGFVDVAVNELRPGQRFGVEEREIVGGVELVLARQIGVQLATLFFSVKPGEEFVSTDDEKVLSPEETKGAVVRQAVVHVGPEFFSLFGRKGVEVTDGEEFSFHKACWMGFSLSRSVQVLSFNIEH
jgi:hypothetical protein